jgi:hypothetical protein
LMRDGVSRLQKSGLAREGIQAIHLPSRFSSDT